MCRKAVKGRCILRSGRRTKLGKQCSTPSLRFVCTESTTEKTEELVSCQPEFSVSLVTIGRHENCQNGAHTTHSRFHVQQRFTSLIDHRPIMICCREQPFAVPSLDVLSRSQTKENTRGFEVTVVCSSNKLWLLNNFKILPRQHGGLCASRTTVFRECAGFKTQN